MFGRREYDRRMRIDHYFHSDPSPGGPPDTRIDQLLGLVQALGAEMSRLSDLVDRVVTGEADEDAQAAAVLAAKDAIIAELQAQNSDLGSQLTTALANDVADAATIQAKTDELAAAAADLDAQIARLEEAFPGPVVEPVEEPPVEEPPVV